MSTTLTLEERATNYDTMRHIRRVGVHLNTFVKALLDRATDHDQSKLASPEVEALTEHTDALASSTYASKEYDNRKASTTLAPALAHHYANNRHHPEHFKDGIDDMNLVDLVEMFCDWKAATERHHDGNLRKSVEHNGERFHMAPQLVRIFENTIELLDD